ncbi:Gfo/Idh/MocA family protein [Leuconostoc mesenteroides]
MKLGIIGSGNIVSEFLSFVENIKNIELVAIYGREKSIDKLYDIKNNSKIKKIYTEYNQLLLDDDIDTIYVALPNNLHFDFAEKGLLSGKNVILEKPFVQTMAEFKALQKIAQEKNLHLYEAISNQYSPNFKKITQWINEIGDIRLVSLNYSQLSSRYAKFKTGNVLPAFNFKTGGGALQDLNVYNLHLLTGLFGNPRKVNYTYNFVENVDTSGILTLEYPNFISNAIAGKDVFSIKNGVNFIEGDKGYISIDRPTNDISVISLHTENGIDTVRLPEQHRMFYEFETFANKIEINDLNFMNKMLEHSQMVMEILTTVKKQIQNDYPEK